MTLEDIKSMKRIQCDYEVCKWNSQNYCTNPNVKIGIDIDCKSVAFNEISSNK